MGLQNEFTDIFLTVVFLTCLGNSYLSHHHDDSEVIYFPSKVTS
jgi:hypothetical protein